MRSFQNIVPKRNRFKKAIFRFRIRLMTKGFIACAHHDVSIQNEIAKWPDELTIRVQVLMEEPDSALRKDVKGIYIVNSNYRSNLEVIISFKNLITACGLLSGRVPVGRAFIEEKFFLKGDPACKLSIVRSMIFAQNLLFPRLVSKGSLKQSINNYLRSIKIITKIFTIRKKREGVSSSDTQVLRVFE